MIKLIINWTLFFLLFPIWFPFWLSCRLAAKNCPQCRSKWQVELVGEWEHLEHSLLSARNYLINQNKPIIFLLDMPRFGGVLVLPRNIFRKVVDFGR